MIPKRQMSLALLINLARATRSRLLLCSPVLFTAHTLKAYTRCRGSILRCLSPAHLCTSLTGNETASTCNSFDKNGMRGKTELWQMCPYSLSQSCPGQTWSVRQRDQELEATLRSLGKQRGQAVEEKHQRMDLATCREVCFPNLRTLSHVKTT